MPPNSSGIQREDLWALENKLELLKQDITEKHRQNRDDIHSLQNSAQVVANRHHLMELKLAPIFGEDGVIQRQTETIAKMEHMLDSLAMAQAENAGVKKFLKTSVPLGVGVLALVVPFLVVVFEKLLGVR